MICLPYKRQERGTVLIVVMVLLALMCGFMAWSAHSIFSLKTELRMIEKKQLKRYESAVAAKGRAQ